MSHLCTSCQGDPRTAEARESSFGGFGRTQCKETLSLCTHAHLMHNMRSSDRATTRLGPMCEQVEQLADPALPVAEIVAKCPREQLMAVYGIPAFADADQFLQLVAAARGKLGKVWSTTLLTCRSAGCMVQKYRLLAVHCSSNCNK